MLELCGLWFLYGGLRLYGILMDKIEDWECARYDRLMQRDGTKYVPEFHEDTRTDLEKFDLQENVVDAYEYAPGERFWN